MLADPSAAVDDNATLDSAEEIQLDLERCAVLDAFAVHFRRADRTELFERLDVDPEIYKRARQHWIEQIREALERDEDALAARFGRAFTEKKRALDAERPTLESLGPRRERPTRVKLDDEHSTRELESGATARALPHVVSTASSTAADVPVARKLLTPSYLKHPAGAAGPAREDGDDDVDRTVLGGLPTARPFPFAGFRGAPPPVLPVEPAADTAAGSLPAVVLSAVVRPAAAEFDPDVTQPPMPNPLPVVPFSGTSTPERMREIAGAPVREPSDAAGETVALPSSEDMKSLAEAARADLPLPEYAALRAALSIHGDDNAEVLAQFGLTTLQKQAIQLKYFSRFRDEPALRERFEAFLRDAMRRINRG